MTMTATADSSTRQELAARARTLVRSRWFVPALLGLALAFVAASGFAKSVTAPRSTSAEDAATIGQAVRSAVASAVTPTSVAASGPEYFDYLTPMLAYPLTEEARSIITFEPGTANLHMKNSQAVAQQILALPGVDQCRLAIGIEERATADKTTVRARVVYPPEPDGSMKAGKVPLVSCSNGQGPTGTIPTVTTAPAR